MGERWHWDEQRALREELAALTHAAADERLKLEAEIDYWRRRTGLAEERERRAVIALAAALLDWRE